MTAQRKHIAEHIKLKVWTEAGGRCEFRNCNKPLWYNELTLSDTKFSELAHIIGASEIGPRGNKDSQELQDKPENLMLLCERCHKEIDYGKNIKDYPAEVLREMKREHEERVRLALDSPRRKTSPLIFQCKIGDRIIPIETRAVLKSLKPYLPDAPKHDWLTIKLDSFDRNSPEWWKIAENDIDKKVSSLVNRYENGEIQQISVFALGPMPLLMYLGKCLGDTIPGNIMQAHRNVAPEDIWCWNKKQTVFHQYEVKCLHDNTSKNVALVLALSDSIAPEKYINSIPQGSAIYEITTKNPTPTFFDGKADWERFSRVYRMKLNEIQQKHGMNCVIHILPAVPNSFAIECGRVLLPTKDPNIVVYEFFPKNGGFKKVLTLLE